MRLMQRPRASARDRNSTDRSPFFTIASVNSIHQEVSQSLQPTMTSVKPRPLHATKPPSGLPHPSGGWGLRKPAKLMNKLCPQKLSPLGYTSDRVSQQLLPDRACRTTSFQHGVVCSFSSDESTRSNTADVCPIVPQRPEPTLDPEAPDRVAPRDSTMTPFPNLCGNCKNVWASMARFDETDAILRKSIDAAADVSTRIETNCASLRLPTRSGA